MLRYLRRLSARDYALDRGMIPLGSCTMKLNATTEMEPMGAADRKVVHDTANTIDGVRTTSEGEEPRRHVVILPDA